MPAPETPGPKVSAVDLDLFIIKVPGRESDCSLRQSGQ